MAGYPPPYPPPPPPGPPYGPDWKYQRRMLREQARAQRDMIRAQRDAYRAQVRAMRRTSIVGPLLVVIVGIVFLLVQTGRLASHSLWFWYSRWWPLLLVSVGLVLLGEWLFDHYTHHDPQQPQPRRTLGGGVFTVVVLLIITGIIASASRGNADFFAHGFSLNPDNIDEFLGEKHESDQTIDQAFPANTTLTISNPRGDISVSGTSDDNRIHIAMHKVVYTRSDSEAASKAQQLVPQIISTTPGNFTVDLPNMAPALADLTITVPASTPTTINANHGDVRIHAIQGPVNITSNHGDVEVSAITGPVITHINNGDSSFSAHSVTGPISVEGHGHDLTLSDIAGAVSLGGDYFGTTHLEHINGTVRFHTSRTDFQLARLDGQVEINHSDISGDQIVGPLTLSAGNKNISIERASGDVSVTNRNGSIDLTSAPPLGNVNLENRNGSVNLTLPEQAGFTLQAQTSNGDLESDFDLPTQESNNRKSIAGTIGKGGPLVRITTSEGDLSVKKASLSPLPPPPPMPPSPPRLSINDGDGSSVYIGKDGVRIVSGRDGSSVIAGKDGLRINTNADGSSTYVARDGTRLITNTDGTSIFTTREGTRYTANADGSKSYVGKDGTRIAINADGTKTAIDSRGKTLSDAQINDRIHQIEAEMQRAAQQRDTERRIQKARQH